MPIAKKKVKSLKVSLCISYIRCPHVTLFFFADFVFSNITKDGTEESVARLGLTCVQDWDETGAQEKMVS